MPAEAVYWAATHRRRELIVGGSALKAIAASMVAPGLADRYLARTGYDAQQMQGVPVDRDRPDNLFEPVEDGASQSLELWLATHRGALLAAAGGALLAARSLRR
ncbi:MAG TPA: hypothetical protein VLB81_05205 [Gaiellales bacterium]|nr:hypothetical protein [Gaiellales bacterium]